MRKLPSVFEKPLFLASISLSQDHILSLGASFDNTRLIHHLCGRIFTNIVVVVSAIGENSKQWQNINLGTLANIRFPFYELIRGTLCQHNITHLKCVALLFNRNIDINK